MKLDGKLSALLFCSITSLSACKAIVGQNANFDYDYDDPNDTADYSVPQYEYEAGVATDAIQYRMNKAMSVISNHCISCHAGFGDLSARKIYSAKYWSNSLGHHPWIEPGDPGNSPVITYLRLPAAIKSIQNTAIAAGRFNPYLISQDGSQNMPQGGSAISYDEFTALWDWIKYIDNPEVHVIHIAPGAGASAYTSASNYFTVQVGDRIALYNDDSTSLHFLTGSMASLFNQGSSLAVGENSLYTILRDGMTNTLGGSYTHRDGSTNANFHLKVEN